MMFFRSAVLAIPVAFGLAVAPAVAADPVSMTPLGPAHREQVASLGATCAVPYDPAKLAAIYFVYPTVSREVGAEGMATVGVSLLPNGRVVRAWPITSTGNAMLDRAALDSARESRYVPERSQCAPVGGDYKIDVDFSLDR